MVEVVAPQLLKSRAVGLCGDMNGERSADLKTPGQCVMRPHLAAVSYLINKSGSASGFKRCSGIPSTLKTEFKTESAKCARETVIPTPVSILAERISLLNRPVGMTHVVDKQSTKLCISKQMVKTCLSTMWDMPVGLFKTEMRSYSLETGVGMMVSREHLVDSRWNSCFRPDGRPERPEHLSKPDSEPDLLSM